MFLYVLCSYLMLILIFRKKLFELILGRYVSNEFDRFIRDYRQFELEIIIENVIKLKILVIDVQEVMVEVENYL